MELRKGRHCVFNMHVHLVFVTKYRGDIFTAKHFVMMEKVFNKVCADFDAVVKEFNGEKNHIHLLVEYHPKVAVSKLVNSLKGVSSRRLREKFPELGKFKSLWSPSYFSASCGGAPLDMLKQYIKQQERPS
jgi:putative transposase